MDGQLVIISGPSGVGKDTVIDAWRRINEKVARVVTYTTRGPRPNERHGIDHHFVGDEEFRRLSLANEFADERLIFGARYGIARKSIEEAHASEPVIVANVDVVGGLKLMRLYPRAIAVFLLPPSPEELRARLASRGTLDRAREERAIAEIGKAHLYQYRLVNEHVGETVAALERILRSGAIR
jgi:guanylate kinase